MKFYVASKFDNYKRVRVVCQRLRMLGHTITFDWTVGREFDNFGRCVVDVKSLPAMDQMFFAVEDMNGAKEADVLILLIEEDMCGALMEVGMALASGKLVFVVGEVKRWTIFYALRQCVFFDSIDDVYHAIRNWS